MNDVRLLTHIQVSSPSRSLRCSQESWLSLARTDIWEETRRLVGWAWLGGVCPSHKGGVRRYKAFSFSGGTARCVSRPHSRCLLCMVVSVRARRRRQGCVRRDLASMMDLGHVGPHARVDLWDGRLVRRRLVRLLSPVVSSYLRSFLPPSRERAGVRGYLGHVAYKRGNHGRKAKRCPAGDSQVLLRRLPETDLGMHPRGLGIFGNA